MRGKFKMIILIGVIILVLFICVYVGMLIHWVNNTEIEMEGKTCITVQVAEEEVIDYSTFLDPRDKMYELGGIEESIRFQIADYMKANNLKLKEGTHTILREGIVNGEPEKFTYNDYMKMFKFEKIN